MKKLIGLAALLFCLGSFTIRSVHKDKWISLFDGKSLNGWKVGANPETFRVENGVIVAGGNTAHLFYDGPVIPDNIPCYEEVRIKS